MRALVKSLASFWTNCWRRPVLVGCGLGLPWAVFAGVAAAVHRFGACSFDRPLLWFWHRHATPGLDALAVALTVVGNTGPAVGAGLLVLALLLKRGRRAEAVAFAVAVGGSMLLTQAIKALVLRPRPALWLSIRPEHSLSFPSGHAMDTAALATAVSFLLWQRRVPWPALVPAVVFSLLVGWARVYLGVHYPSDVLAGWAAAVGWVLLVQGLWPGALLGRSAN